MKIDITNAIPAGSETAFNTILEEVIQSHALLLSGKGKGNDFIGWVKLPAEVPAELVSRIIADASRIRDNGPILVVTGIGGSYLGARAVIDALSHHFAPLMPGRKTPYIIYAGENLSEDYHSDLLQLLDQYDYSVCVISKSGTTTEPAVAFRILRNHLEKKYGKANAASRIIAVTDASRGALKKMAGREGYPTYVIPDDVGGRYSVLTPVGLLPVAAAGFSIEKLLEGARSMQNRLMNGPDPVKNPAMLYAAVRNLLYRSGKTTEVMVSFEPRLLYLTEWWKQLYGESEGKENKGIFPAGVTFTTDLHSMGQYLQEGLRNLFETVISVESANSTLNVPVDPEDNDGLNFLAGKRLTEINHMAELGTKLAHLDGGVPNIRISVPSISEFTIGELIYFFEFACALSGYTLGVNPFDQPGVEAYKKNMFALLDKPGHEEQGKELRKRAGL
jgi:glucose-6-phosphate isomerase